MYSSRVQTYLSKDFIDKTLSSTDFRASINEISFNWIDQLTVNELKIYDHHDSLMIYLPSLALNLDFFEIISTGKVHFEQVTIEDGKLSLIHYEDAKPINISLFSFQIRETLSSQSNSGSSSGRFEMDEVIMENFRFSLNNLRLDSLKDRFDANHMIIDSIDAKFLGFFAVYDTVATKIEGLTGINRQTGKEIENLSTDFLISSKQMHFGSLNLELGNSIFRNELHFSYSGYGDLDEFVDKVEITSNMGQSIFYSKDMAIFNPRIGKYDEFYILSGLFKGNLKRFEVDDMILEFGKNSKIYGYSSFIGLPNIWDSFVELKLNNSYFDIEDLKKYIPKAYESKIDPYGKVFFDGRFIGFPNDFVANGTFKTPIGNVESDVNLKLVENGKAKYSGYLNLSDFDFGKASGEEEIFQRVSMTGAISGEGLSIKNADLRLDAYFEKFGLNDYEYRDIYSKVSIKNEFAEGQLTVNDANLKVKAEGTVDLTGNEKIDITGTLDTLALKPLKWTDKELAISSSFDVDVKGLSLDSIEGNVNLLNASFNYDERNFMADTLKFASSIDSLNRSLSLKSDWVDYTLNGNFSFQELFTSVTNLIEEYKVSFKNDSLEISSYYQKRKSDSVRFNAKVEGVFKDFNPVLELLKDDWNISSNSRFTASFEKDATSQFRLYSTIDTIRYNGLTFHSNVIDLNSSKISTKPKFLSTIYLESGNQHYKNKPGTENLILEAVWNENEIDLYSNLEQASSGNVATIVSKIEFLNNQTIFSVQDSELRIIDKNWEFSEKNKIIYEEGKFTFQNINLFHEGQDIAFNGTLSNDSLDNINVDLKNFSLATLNPLLDEDYEGELNLSAVVGNLFNNPFVESDIFIDGLSIDGFPVGQIVGSSHWNTDENRFDLDFELIKDQKEVLTTTGYFTPKQNMSDFRLNAKLSDLNLNIIEPYVDNLVSELKGTVSGNLKVIGDSEGFQVLGYTDLNESAFKLNYLSTNYEAKGRIGFEENEVFLDSMILSDLNLQEALFKGSVFHRNFKKAFINLDGEFDNFNVLSSSASDNDLFYGSGFSTGNVVINGPIDNVAIKAQLKTEKNTRVFIPIGGTNALAEQSQYINFVNLRDTLKLEEEVSAKSISFGGVSFDLDLEITPDAYGEIIFDIKTGDIIRGRGNGNINMKINNQGGFSMLGDYIFTEGGYNFTLPNIINKEFEIQPDSRISWYGDPYKGLLDITATYKQLASLEPLFIDPNAQATTLVVDSAQLKRRYPTRVNLYLTEQMLSPTINFDIEVDQLPEQLNREFELAEAAFDEQELKRQVFSLVILKRFSPINSFDVAGGQSVENSVSELISNQLSYWVSQFDDNLEIDIDLGTFDQEAFNTFQLRLSYVFLDGRLRVTRDGVFKNAASDRADAASIIGDWTIEYLLTEDGRLRVKMFSTNNSLRTGTNLDFSNTNTTGLSLSYTRSFNEFKELLSNARRKNREPLEKENYSEPEIETGVDSLTVQNQ
ncbi:MAG: translocation/assembly module TamB domain-containing protein [Bacteroidota bacterium]